MTILIVDDDPTLREELAAFVSLSGKRPLTAANLAEARETLRTENPDVVLADLYLGGERGTDLIAEAPSKPMIVISGQGSIKEAIGALRIGAYDFLEKPIETERLLGLLRNIERNADAERRLTVSREGWLAEHAAFAPGSAFQRAAERAKEAAASPLAVLINGPSGSGKEILARYVHFCSERSAGPFVAVNCAAIPPELAEAAFFGAKKGAYTGADADRDGFFQSARGGTLFLDELGEIPLAVQAKLLRAVENGELVRLGSTATEQADARLVSATNRPLLECVAAKTFREDLYWRLAQTTIEAPALDRRREDIVPLAHFFLNRIQEGVFDTVSVLDGSAEDYLRERAWPGNVRELRAFVERAVWSARGGVIDAARCGKAERDRPMEPGPGGQAGQGRTSLPGMGLRSGRMMPLREAKEEFERDYVRAALASSDYSVVKAAQALGLLPNNLSRKLRELGLSIDDLVSGRNPEP